MLLDSRDEPWSAAERLAHRVFRAGGLTGWQTNVPVRCGDRRYFLDVVFREARLVVEIDGRIHLLPDAFESDRQRGNDLLLAGWRVIHVTWRMLVDEPERVVAMIRRALRDARR
jgi:very-short-patch-repair endonuclease